ncbi:hypothetical protein Taro_029546, partial [Colocasia esculenta]|nr:hypothetical protein [Colocasia esculenta]
SPAKITLVHKLKLNRGACGLADYLRLYNDGLIFYKFMHSIFLKLSIASGVEMALIDAVANSIRVPLWRLFGGATNSVTTDITIPIVSPDAAAGLAANYQKKGFTTLKLKVGKDLNADIEVLRAVRVAHPTCSFILDANEGYTAPEAIGVLEKFHEMGLAPILFEQPVHRDDWEGLCHVSHVAKGRYGVSVAADESCRSLEDAYKIIEGNLAHVINIKLAKLGVLGSLEVIEAARRAGLGLMIGGMVETRLAMGFSGHLAAGMGCFSFIDLDTPLLLSEDPVIGGYEVSGPVYKFTNARGHGGFLHWDSIACASPTPFKGVGRIAPDATVPGRIASHRARSAC